MKIVAIDPGYERVGIAVVESGTPKELVLYSNCFRTNKNEAFPDRLREVGREVERIIRHYSPDTVALEQLFFNTNQKTAMHVAEVRGALMYIAGQQGCAVREYTPLQIKMAILGYGRGEKRQIMDMVRRLIVVTKDIHFDDEYDAIAIGLTCLACEKNFQLNARNTKNIAS